MPDGHIDVGIDINREWSAYCANIGRGGGAKSLFILSRMQQAISAQAGLIESNRSAAATASNASCNRIPKTGQVQFLQRRFFFGRPCGRTAGGFNADSIRAVHGSQPKGRPCRRQCRRAATSAGVCAWFTHVSQSSRRGTGQGANAISGESGVAVCPRLDHGQSSARVTSPHRSGLRST